MGLSPLDSEVAVAGRLVRAAGELAASMLADGLRASTKTSISDVVTAADHAAEALIVEGLATAFPSDAVIGEEGTDREGTSGRTWVIDPVDGTWNFVNGLTWWCSALALRDEADVLLGAVFHPHDDALFLGGPSLPSTRNGVALPRVVDRPLRESCVTTYLHPPFFSDPVGEAFTRAIASAATMRMLGSGTMDHMAIAQGQMHVLFQHSVPEWDWLPGSAILRGLGGSARRTTAAGVVWSVAGAPSAVDEICASLEAQG